jgi:hypothetical protein
MLLASTRHISRQAIGMACKSVVNASRIAVLLGEFIQSWGDDRDVRGEPSIERLG